MDKHDFKLAQRVINEVTGANLSVDGDFGQKSKTALRTWQKEAGLAVNGILDETAWVAMQPHIERRFVTIQDIIKAAEDDGLPPSMLLAFWEVESIGAGFLNSGKCVTLFEGHKFYEYVSDRISRRQAEAWRAKYPDLCYPKSTSVHYRTGEREWARFERARTLDATCALLSTSWGLFQLMGFNYAYADYANVQDMVADHMESEHHHLASIVKYINNYTINARLRSALGVRNLREAVIKKDFVATAHIYNGPAYARHNYDKRLRDAEHTWSTWIKRQSA